MEIYFDLESDWSNWEESWKGPRQTIFTYIILPTDMHETRAFAGPSSVCAISSIILRPSVLNGLTIEKKAQFQLALKTLQIHIKCGHRSLSLPQVFFCHYEKELLPISRHLKQY